MSAIIKHNSLVIKLFLFVSFYTFVFTGCATVPIFNQETNLNLQDEEKIIFLSDTQSPIWLETLFLDENNNEMVRSRIFENIIETKPKAVIHLGDLVSFGFWNNDWEDIDLFVDSLRSCNTNFYPILGNHELLFFSCAGGENFMERFPFALKTGYSVTIGSLGIILLNSNFSYLSNAEIEQQNVWYKNELFAMENDSTITSIIVGTHHPPFTNSTIVNPSEEVLENFVPLFLSNNKCKIFMSGHCHAFEHFKYKGKDFIIIGGGGGLQQPLYVGEESKWEDVYDSDSIFRKFHFAELNIKNDSLVFNIKFLNDESYKINETYQVILND
ncbi:MAG: metallophosphoesterase [Ignavibacteriae bacterium]|nr:metallophosphoesterase [Ignavibacteriota bacterium]